jgi:hypothetical protein
MATINPSNLYSGGNVNLDSTPFVKFALAQEAKKAAKDEALDKYFAEKNGKLTSTGMRSQEVPALVALKQQITDYGIKNKKSIHDLKDGGKAWGEYNNMWNMAQSVIDNSKALNGVSDLTGKIRINHPELADRFDENTVKGLADHEQAAYIVQGNKVVDNPLHKTFDINSVQYNPELYTPKQLQDQLEEEIKFTPRDVNKEDIKKTNDLYTNKVSTISSYNDDKIKKIADNRGSAFDTDKRLKFTFNQGHDLLKTPFNEWKQSHVDNYNQLNTDFKRIYNKDIETPKELYKAEVVSSIKDPIKTKEEFRINKAAENAEWNRRNKIINGQHRANILLNKNATDNGVTVNDVYDKLVQNQKNADINTHDINGNKIKAARFNALPLDAANIVMSSVKGLVPDASFDNIYTIQEPDGSIGIYETDINNAPMPSLQTRITTISRTGVNLKAQPNAKAKTEVVRQGEPTKPSSSNTPTNTKNYKPYSGKVKGM